MKLTAAINRLRAYLGLDRNVLVMTVGRSLRRLGTDLWTEYLPKVLETLGASAPMIGTFGTINSGFSTFYSYLGGAISDRLGRGRVLIFSAGVAMVGYFIYAVSPLWWLFIPGSILLTASVFFDFMGSLAMFGESVQGNRRAVSMASVGIIALPVSLVGPPLGGLLIANLGIVGGFRVGVIATIVLTFVGIVVQRRYYRLPPPAAEHLAVDMRDAWRAMPRPLRSMLVANCLMAFGAGMSKLFVVLYVMNIMEVSAIRFGLLQSVFVASSSLLSIPVGKFSDRRTGLGRKPFVSMAFLLIAIYPVLLVLAPSPAWLWPIFFLRGVRETFDTIRKAMIIDLAGEGERGKIIGLYFFIVGVAGFPASFIAGWLWTWNPIAPFLTGAALCLVGYIVFLFVRGETRVTSS